MNKLFLLIFCFPGISAKAQTTVYHPFPDSAAEWRDILALCDDPITLPAYVLDYRYSLCGDTVINSLTYHKLCTDYTYDEEYYYSSTLSSSYFYSLGTTGAIREDSLRRIYYYDFQLQADTLLYDFSNLSAGSSLPLSYANADSFAYVLSVDSVLIGGVYRTAYRIDDSTDICPPFNLPLLIEGVGFSTGLFQLALCTLHDRYILLCFQQNDQLLFHQNFTIFHTCNTMLAVDEKPGPQEVVLFPNPSDGQFSILLKTGISHADIEIDNLLGKTVYTAPLSGTLLTIQKKLPAGIYCIKVNCESGQFMQKIMVK